MYMLKSVSIKQYPNYTCINHFPWNRKCFIDINKTYAEKCVLGNIGLKKLKRKL